MFRRPFVCFASALILISVLSCHGDQPTEHSFYYWKTSFSANNNSKQFIERNHINHFYIRYFDVDFSYRFYTPVPRAEIRLDHAEDFLHGNYTPVVFITNNTFSKIHSYPIDSLALKVRNRVLFINHKISSIRAGHGIAESNTEPAEIQIDCDWTENTRDKYFSFLRKLKALMPDKIISVTIRLYPYKYRTKMGVPPADKGLLMCYNLANIKSLQTNNSVFDNETLEQYLDVNKYPLPLDVALPIFGWHVRFSEGKYQGIVYDNEMTYLTDSNYFKIANNQLEALEDIEIGDQYIRRGDLLRKEFPSPAELEDAARLLRKKIPGCHRIAFFHYDQKSIEQYAPTIEKIYSLY